MSETEGQVNQDSIGVDEIPENPQEEGNSQDGSKVGLESSWPKPPGPAAFHGLAGEIVEALSPTTEADPVAILAQLLVAFGSVAGRGPHFVVERDRHGVNLFA